MMNIILIILAVTLIAIAIMCISDLVSRRIDREADEYARERLKTLTDEAIKRNVQMKEVYVHSMRMDELAKILNSEDGYNGRKRAAVKAQTYLIEQGYEAVLEYKDRAILLTSELETSYNSFAFCYRIDDDQQRWIATRPTPLGLEELPQSERSRRLRLLRREHDDLLARKVFTS